MAAESGEPDGPQDEPESYVGLAAEEAERRAYESGWSTVRTLPPDAIITMEYLTGRINLAVENGIVVRCWPG